MLFDRMASKREGTPRSCATFEVSFGYISRQIRRRLEQKLLAEVRIIAFGFIDSRRNVAKEGHETVNLSPLRRSLSEHLNEIAMSYDV